MSVLPFTTHPWMSVSPLMFNIPFNPHPLTSALFLFVCYLTLFIYLFFSYSGVHHKGKNCSPEFKKKAVEKLLRDNKQNFFPNVLTLAGFSGLRLRDPKPNGGWGDSRDRQLCMSFIYGNSSNFNPVSKNRNFTKS